ncbi:MAG TPA: TetR/AcrR family transcriptional regulator [Solirubrobacteraceae bacterium]
MTARLTPIRSARGRRTPVQRRSRDRFERILQAAEQLVVSSGVQALGTREAAHQADIPVATLYQYFADRDAIISALIERHVSSMDARIAMALGSLRIYSIRSVVETTVEAYRAAYRERPSYVVLWFQGRLNADIAAYIRERDEKLADQFHRFGITTGLLTPDVDPLVLRLCFEIADRFLEAAYRHELSGDDRVVDEGVEMIVSHLERYATPAGVGGIAADAITARWGVS